MSDPKVCGICGDYTSGGVEFHEICLQGGRGCGAPVMGLLPFMSEPRRCPKCGRLFDNPAYGYSSRVTYHTMLDGDEGCPAEGSEHLDVCCQSCGYEIQTKTADMA